MKLEERIELIVLRVKKLKIQVAKQKGELNQLQNENKQLKFELDALKKTNFELKEKTEITNIANQLSNNGNSGELKRKIDKYIREVDAAIAVLKEVE